jgi:hypothetical protein
MRTTELDRSAANHPLDRRPESRSLASPGHLEILLIGNFGNGGDLVCGFHQQADPSADLLLLLMGMVVELSWLVHQRHLLGRPTVLEGNDWLPGVQGCNSANANWSEPRAWGLLSQPRRHRPGLDQLAGSPPIHNLPGARWLSRRQIWLRVAIQRSSPSANRPIGRSNSLCCRLSPPGQVAPEQQQVGPVGGEGQRHLPLRQPTLQSLAG